MTQADMLSTLRDAIQDQVDEHKRSGTSFGDLSPKLSYCMGGFVIQLSDGSEFQILVSEISQPSR